MNSSDDQPKCGSIEASLQIIGDKWSGLIIRNLTAGPQRFTALEQSLGIGPRTLSQRLDDLQTAGVISKKQFAEAPPRVEYSLTKKGEDLLPILQSMASWCTKYS
ncbi:MAG TPA: helix-turn-helix domain-containing protein [Candidatus Saccharimonadales bacterium]|nr:helix-turn-helix domain-containing protein [Candidatus Saccharimonadales bacterium]